MKTSGREPKLEQQTGQARSPKIPGPQGGILIRRVIRNLRLAGVALPFEPSSGSHILIACSGGLDSTALTTLIANYGAKLTRDAAILHINHGWRGDQSDQDAQFVENLARRLGVRFIIERLDPKARPRGRSWEEWARTERKRVYEKHAGPSGLVLTGHQADELCETLLWRLLTGAAKTHGRGILVREGREIRPLLGCFKWELEAFLREEGVSWREDSSNADPRFLRAAFRARLKPELDRQFPRWQEHLLRYAEQPSLKEGEPPQQPVLDFLGECFGAAGIRMRRVHWERLQQWISKMKETPDSSPTFTRDRPLDSLDLEAGWKVRLVAQAGTSTPRIVIERS